MGNSTEKLIAFLCGLGLGIFLSGCSDWDPSFYCNGSLVPETAPAVEKIINGELPNDRLATFALLHNGRAGCSAVALDEHTLLTSAHCVIDAQLDVATEYPADVKYEVVDSYVHRGFVRGDQYHNDIAVLHTAEPMPGPFIP